MEREENKRVVTDGHYQLVEIDDGWTGGLEVVRRSDGRSICHDFGEPEDKMLYRDFADVPEELNRLAKIIEQAAHYVFFGDGQQQGSTRRVEGSPSEQTERGKLLDLLRPFLEK